MLQSTGRFTLELIDEIRDGGETALERFIRRWGPRLLVFIRYKLGRNLAGKVEPEDVLQDFCVGLLENRGRFLDQVDSRGVHRAAFSLLENRIRDLYEFHFKTQKRSARREVRGGGAADDTKGFTLSLLPGSGGSMTQRIENQDEYASLMAIVDELDDTSRELFALKFLKELTNSEIAEELGVSVSTVKRSSASLIERIQQIRLGDGS